MPGNANAGMVARSFQRIVSIWVMTCTCSSGSVVLFNCAVSESTFLFE